MFNFQILDVAIGLAFIYFFLSLVCSVLNEAWAGLIKKRSKMLEQAIASLLKDDQALAKLYQQPLFLGTTPKSSFLNFWISLIPFASLKRKSPSYISSRSFVLSLLESLKQHPEVVRSILQEIMPPPGELTKLNEFEDKLAKLPADHFPYIKAALNKVLTDNVKKLEAIQQWYREGLAEPAVLEKIFQDLSTQKKTSAWELGPDEVRKILKEIIPPPENASQLKEFEDNLARLPDDQFPNLKAALNVASQLGALQNWYQKTMAEPAVLEKIWQDLKGQKKIPGLDSLGSIQKLINYLPDSNDVKKALIPLVESVSQQAGDRLEKAMAAMEKWYDEAMERVTGWYKRYSQAFTLIVAFSVALALNADTFALGQAIYRDQALRTSLVAMAEKAARQSAPAVPPANPPKDNQDKKKLPAKPTARASSKPAQAGSQPAGTGAAVTKSGQNVKTAQKKPEQSAITDEQQQAKIKAEADKLNTYFKEIKALNLPLGWDAWWKKYQKDLEAEKDDKGNNTTYSPEKGIISYRLFLWFWLGTLDLPFLLGIFVTALLVSLGANFWFELLNKLINLRNAGKKPLTAQEAAAQKS